jgi:hypothetical protein
MYLTSPEKTSKCIGMDLRQIVWDGMYWIDLAQDTGDWRVLMDTVMKI